MNLLMFNRTCITEVLAANTNYIKNFVPKIVLNIFDHYNFQSGTPSMVMNVNIHSHLFLSSRGHRSSSKLTIHHFIKFDQCSFLDIQYTTAPAFLTISKLWLQTISFHALEFETTQAPYSGPTTSYDMMIAVDRDEAKKNIIGTFNSYADKRYPSQGVFMTHWMYKIVV